MSIIFHCSHCGKKIEAADNAGGKWGKCPSCHNRVYVPGLNADDDDLELAPIDEAGQKKQKKLMAETFKLSQNILLERESTEESDQDHETDEISDKQLMKNIITYLRQIADGELEEAEKTINSISPYGLQSIKLLDRIALSEIPEPQLADIPDQFRAGLIRTLRNKLNQV